MADRPKSVASIAQLYGAPTGDQLGAPVTDRARCPVTRRKCTCANSGVLPLIQAMIPKVKILQQVQRDEELMQQGTAESIDQALGNRYRALVELEQKSYGRFDSMKCKALQNDD